MYHVSTRALDQGLDQGGVEPRLAVSVRPEGRRQYHYTTAPAADVDLPYMADFCEMFELADANPGPISVPDVEPHHMRVRQQLQHMYSDQELSWSPPLMSTKICLTIRSYLRPISTRPLICFAHICLSLETSPEWSPAIQARSNVDAAGSEGAFAWGLMLPTSTRTARVTYTSIVGVRCDMLCELFDGKWKIGTHT